ncbi:MAG: phage tail sheath family protein [Gammaproteobacteria bacterium]
MKEVRTPGVYIVEKNAFPNSVVEVATAVPAFIGYTQKAKNRDTSLHKKPRRITSMAEYHNYFGLGPPMSFAIGNEKTDDSLQNAAVTQDGVEYYLTSSKQRFNLYNCMLSFFQNGGGPCFIVSVGGYENTTPEAEQFIEGIDALVKEQEPAMVVVPDAVLLDEDNCARVQIASLAHCRTLQSRFAILDVHNGFKNRTDDPDCITAFRNKIGINDLNYGAAYYPWIETTVVQDSAISFRNIDEDSRATLQEIITTELNISESPNGKARQIADLIAKLDGSAWSEDEQKDLKTSEKLLHKSLYALSKNYVSVLKTIQCEVNLLPPSAAMAGVYTMVDNTRGVWKAPANVSLNGVIRPAVNVSGDEQEDLNVNVQGKSVNAIRSFIGQGTLVWGARTLDGNSLDWRYINVRRTLIMLEVSLKLAAKAYVFEANDANTWTSMKNMANNFLTGIWKRGGLAGASPDDAFSVRVGLGETMTAEDILEGTLTMSIMVALTRPAEFIEITFQQQMQAT